MSASDGAEKCQVRMYLGVDLAPNASHGAAVQAMVCCGLDQNQEVLFTAGRDATIKEWKYFKSTSSTDESVEAGFHCQGSWRGHTDWVTTLAMFGNHIISGSCDKSIRVWDQVTGECRSTSRFHIDYVEGISVSEKSNRMVSGGLDNQLYLWDLEKMQTPIISFPEHNDETCRSIYAVGISSSSHLVVSGSSDKVIRLWDPRSGELVRRLSGHTSNIRDVKIDARLSMLVSASSDFTVRMWDLRQGTCVEMHTPLVDGAVWTVAVDPDLKKIYAAGRSKQVVCIDRDYSQTSLVATLESAHVNRLCLNPSQTGLYIATSDSRISSLDVSSLGLTAANFDSELIHRDVAAYACPPCRNTRNDIIGRPPIVQAHVLNDGRFILTQDMKNCIELWDVISQRKIESLGPNCTFDDVLKRYQTEISVPSWFSIDLHLGCLGIILQSSSAFLADIYLEAGADIPPDLVKLGLYKVNLCCLALDSVFRVWTNALRATRTFAEENANRSELRITESPRSKTEKQQSACEGPEIDREWLLPEPDQPVDSPKHAAGTRVGDFESDLDCLIITQQPIGSKSALFRVLNLYDYAEFEDIVAPWVKSWVFDGRLPPIRPCETRFNVVPYPDMNALPYLSVGSTMKADDSLPMRRLACYVITQLSADNEQVKNYFKTVHADRPELVLDIICEEQVLKPLMSLRSARTFAWKNKKIPFTLQYRLNETLNKTGGN